MFDINLLGEPGIQPEQVNISHSFIQREIPIPAPVVQPDDEEFDVEVGISRRLYTILGTIVTIAVLITVAALLKPKPSTSASEMATMQVPAQEEILQIVEVLSDLSAKIHVKRLLVSPDFILLNLFSSDQTELTMLGVELEDHLKTHCRISGNKEDGANLTMNIPVSYETQLIPNTESVMKKLTDMGITEVQDYGFKILARTDEQKITPLLKKVILPDAQYFKRATIELYKGIYTFEILFDISDK